MDDISSIDHSSVDTVPTTTPEGGPASSIPSLPRKWQRWHGGGTPKKRRERCTKTHRRCDPVSHDVSHIGQSEAYNHKDSMRSLPSCENCDRAKMSCSFCPEELRGGLTRWQIENPAPDRKRTKNWRTCDQCHTDADNPNCQPSVDPSECERCSTRGRTCTFDKPRRRGRAEDQKRTEESRTADLQKYNKSPYQILAPAPASDPDTHSTTSLSHFHESPGLIQNTASPANEWDLLSGG